MRAARQSSSWAGCGPLQCSSARASCRSCCRPTTLRVSCSAPPDLRSREPSAVLGVARGASRGDAKRAFRALALLYHPDRNKDSDAGAQFTAVQRAWDAFQDGKAAFDNPLAAPWPSPATAATAAASRAAAEGRAAAVARAARAAQELAFREQRQRQQREEAGEAQRLRTAAYERERARVAAQARAPAARARTTRAPEG